MRYREQPRPVLTGGAQVMDTLFELPQDADAESQCPGGTKEPLGRLA
jgi:hypothetical protein